MFFFDWYYSGKYFNVFSISKVIYLTKKQIELSYIVCEYTINNEFFNTLRPNIIYIKSIDNSVIFDYFIIFKNSNSTFLNYYGFMDNYLMSLYEDICLKNRSESSIRRQAVSEINKIVEEIAFIKFEKLRKKALFGIDDNEKDDDIFKKIKNFFLINKLKIKLIVRKIIYWLFKK